MKQLAFSVSLTLLALFSAPTFAEAASPPETSWLLVRITKPAKMIGYPAVCPGASDEEDQENVICFAELYEAKARVLRHFEGKEIKGSILLRFTAHSFHVVWKKGVRFIVQVSPFSDRHTGGQFAQFWKWEDERGLFCEADDHVKDYDAGAIRRLFAGAPLTKTTASNRHWNTGTEVRCITGRE